ncbi:N-acetyltransferase family protein [Paenibacillus sp. S-38]|uniref:GNAT family N-acetyltransferase n=1 Tax=Paenibacillus sp. S-38 TaxID=3416710 RepID=UPI003CE8D371
MNTSPCSASITLRAADLSEKERLADLRALVLQTDLTRLGRYDEEKVRERFRGAFAPEWTRIVEVEGAFAGCVALRPEGERDVLEHFYLHPEFQGRGIGSRVLAILLSKNAAEGRGVTLNALQGSPVRRLYERFGFRVDREDPIDVFMTWEPEDWRNA